MDLFEIRKSLSKLENIILRGLAERYQYSVNYKCYTQNKYLKIPTYNSFFDYMLYNTEKVHAIAGRYLNPHERPYSENLPSAIIINSSSIQNSKKDMSININNDIIKQYLNFIQNNFNQGEDGEYGDSVTRDIHLLQIISKRIHLGIQVMHIKYHKNKTLFQKLVKNKEYDIIIDIITSSSVEEQIIYRVQEKAENYGIPKNIAVDFFTSVLIPLTKKVELEYLENITS